MTITQNVLIATALVFLSVPALGAQDLSKYRNFSLGSSLAVISKQADVRPDQIATTHQTPAVIQEFTLWPMEPADSSVEAEAVQQMQFSFCDSGLYNITVTYKSEATQGMTNDDMIAAVSASYGVATLSAPESNPAAPLSYSSAYKQLAVWQGSKYSVALSRSPLSQSFQLIMLSKQLQAQADAAIATDVAQNLEDAPQRESARVKKEADDLQTQREANLKAFRP